MAIVWIAPNQFSAFLSERIGYKSGLALNREELIDHLGAADPIAPAITSISDELIPLRTNEIEDAFQILLHRLGCIEKPFVAHGPTLLHVKYGADAKKHALLERVLSLLGTNHFDKGKRALSDGFNKSEFYQIIQTSLPRDALSIAVELVELIELSERASPFAWLPARRVEWKDAIELRDLFASESLSRMYGTFFDQRFVDYLSENSEKVEAIHWRQFEALTAEFFTRNGWKVDLGPGRNDGGVDIRVWSSSLPIGSAPTILVQCKRQKEKIGKVVVKALWADVVDEGATSGLIVTSSTISPGADTVRRARSYPIEVADKESLRSWVKAMRTPGTGVFLGS